MARALLAKCVVAPALLCALARQVEAQPGATLVVERKPGAEGCPDTEALAGRIERIRGRSAAQAKVGYRVTFARDDDVFSATIRSNPDGAGVRTLDDRGATCAALAQATAVTLALLFDSDANPSEPSPPSPTPPPAPPKPAPTPSTAPEASAATPPPFDRRSIEVIPSVGAGAIFGVIQNAAPAISLDTSVSIDRWRVGAGVLGVVPQEIALGPGAVRESLLSGTARLCYAPRRSDSFSLDVCAGGYLGRLTATGLYYTTNTEQRRAWLAGSLEGGASYFWGIVGMEMSAAALVPLQRQDFRIDNLGVAYPSTPIAWLLSLRLAVRFKL